MALTKLKTEGAFIMPKMDATWGGSEPSLDDEGVSQLLFRPFRALSISISTQRRGPWAAPLQLAAAGYGLVAAGRAQRKRESASPLCSRNLGLCRRKAVEQRRAMLRLPFPAEPVRVLFASELRRHSSYLAPVLEKRS